MSRLRSWPPCNGHGNFNGIGISNGLNNGIGHGHVRTNGHSNKNLHAVTVPWA
jgi:hypothetical protein